MPVIGGLKCQSQASWREPGSDQPSKWSLRIPSTAETLPRPCCRQKEPCSWFQDRKPGANLQRRSKAEMVHEAVLSTRTCRHATYGRPTLTAKRSRTCSMGGTRCPGCMRMTLPLPLEHLSSPSRLLLAGRGCSITRGRGGLVRPRLRLLSIFAFVHDQSGMPLLTAVAQSSHDQEMSCEFNHIDRG